MGLGMMDVMGESLFTPTIGFTVEICRRLCYNQFGNFVFTK